MSDKPVLYGTPFSFYTAKARSYLQCKGVDFDEQLSTLSVYKNILIPKTGVRMIPVVKTADEKYLQDTCTIIEHYEQHSDSPGLIPQTPRQKLVSYLFELWADEWLLLPAMHYRWNKDNSPYIFREFGKVIAPWAPGFIRGRLGKKLATRFQGFLPALGITLHSAPAIEEWFENQVLPQLDEHFKHHAYLLGDAPSLGDIALMGPLYAHLYLDPVPGEILRAKAPHLVQWIERMQTPLTDKPQQWLADDQIPRTLMPLLESMFRQQWPVLVDVVIQLEEWALTYPEQQDIPRTIGKHPYRIDNVTEQRAILTFQQWKLQRVLDVYQSFEQQAREQTDELVDEMGARDYLQFRISKPLARSNNRLVFA